MCIHTRRKHIRANANSFCITAQFVFLCVRVCAYVLKSNSGETVEGRMPGEEELSWDHPEDKG